MIRTNIANYDPEIRVADTDTLIERLKASRYYATPVRLAIAVSLVHWNQKRLQGTPYLDNHVNAIAMMMADLLDIIPTNTAFYKDRHELLSLALIHDVVEDTPITHDNIKHLFGGTQMMAGSMALDKNLHASKREYVENFANVSPGAQFVKILDRINNLLSPIHDQKFHDRYIHESFVLLVAVRTNPFAILLAKAILKSEGGVLDEEEKRYLNRFLQITLEEDI